MLVRFFAIATAFISALAQQGPSSLYTLLNGQTFNPPGYTIVMYQSCMQNQNAGNPCGSFSGYQSSNGQYTYQLYGPEAAVSPTCSRTFHLTLACGPTMQMSGVNENPTCVYSATLSLPQVCGVSLAVGQEAASVSPTAVPPSVSSTNTLTATPTTTLTGSTTNTATATPLFMITAFPSTTSTMTLTATATPLYMITAYPTPSPVNVSATSTPLYYYTAYPSVQPNGTGGLLGMATSLIESGSSTSVIIGSVALGIVGLGAIGGAIAYFRGGGTVGGFLKKVEAQKGAIGQFANALPISAEQKAKLNKVIDDPTSVLPPQATALLEKAEGLKEQALAANQSIVQMLPPSIAEAVVAKETALVHPIQEQVHQKIEAVQSFAPAPVGESLEAIQAPIATSLVQVAMTSDQVELVKAFLAEKTSQEKTS